MSGDNTMWLRENRLFHACFFPLVLQGTSAQFSCVLAKNEKEVFSQKIGDQIKKIYMDLQAVRGKMPAFLNPTRLSASAYDTISDN